MTPFTNLFKSGSLWLRADFHLHTRADKQFSYSDEHQGNDFLKNYIDRLQQAGIRIGVIANHNKFDESEFKNLKRKAAPEEIFLLPGVELSLAEGANGVHAILVFEPESWLNAGNDFINRFLDAAFPNLPRDRRENKDLHSQWNLHQTIEQLETHHQQGRDSFLIMAHVDEEKGFCKEIGKRLESIVREYWFQKYVLGFQKVTRQQTQRKLTQWLGENQPAAVEGSDPKCLEDLGRFRLEQDQPALGFLKMGAFTFVAVKYALMDRQRHTIGAKTPVCQHAGIKSLTFQTADQAPLAGATIYFNPNLNNLIGIRGSGKSTLLEVVRFALGKELTPELKDYDYKTRLIYHALRSGGKVMLELVNAHQQTYRIERIYQEQPVIFRDGVQLPRFSVDDNLINVLYFGQKDLAEVGTEGFSRDLMEKFFGLNLSPIREAIQHQQRLVQANLEQLRRLDEITNLRNETVSQYAAIQEKLRIYHDFQLDEKLKKQVSFLRDRSHLQEMIELAEQLLANLRQLISENYETMVRFTQYRTDFNPALFETVQQAWHEIMQKLASMLSQIDSGQAELSSLQSSLNQLTDALGELQDEFAEIKRSMNLTEINPDDYVQLNRRLNITELKLNEIDHQEKKRQELSQLLDANVAKLQSLWRQEFQSFQTAIDDLNARGLAIQVELIYQGDKKALAEFLKALLPGSGITSDKIQKLAESYENAIEIYRELDQPESAAVGILNRGVQLQKFGEAIQQNAGAVLTFQVPNRFRLKYHQKPINEHSLGQRASAIMVFLLARRENDLIIIDQPEDDIDNQSIYRDLICQINQLKGQVQFLFATHNPNIPVLGECEQVIVCRYEQERILATTGSIDQPAIQQAIIDIMEGGQEAFEQREKKYQEWKR
ncbi:hypothetical protein L0128_17380 [candidate division KSB1 bacterium]|nr:hypothetical protein [candidate division KSB1 bacterium]